MTHFKKFWDPFSRVAAVFLEPLSARRPVRHLENGRVRQWECHQLAAECQVLLPDWNRVGMDSHGRTLGAVPWNLTALKGLHQYHQRPCGPLYMGRFAVRGVWGEASWKAPSVPP